MAEANNIREVIERVVSTNLVTYLTALRDELVDQACEQLAELLPVDSGGGAPGATTGRLNAAVNSLLECSTQAEILAALLDGSTSFAQRAALFVIRGSSATGWRAAGLDNNEGIKSVAVELGQGLAARAYHSRGPAAGSAVEFDSVFVSTYGAPADGTNALVVPLVVRDKVAAILYADQGVAPGGRLDASALECLVRFAGLWLEVTAIRKGGLALPEHEVERVAPSPQPPPPVAAAPPAIAPQTVTSTPAAVAAAVPPMPAPVAEAAPALETEEDEIHKKARRFAKLLVDEIKLYNQAKVAEGRANRDLYARLKDDIEKSRAAYDKRYADTAAASGNYFTGELVRILANDDPSLLGGGFPG